MTDKMIGLGFAALGVAILVLSLQLPPPLAATHIAYGAGFFPSILGIAIAVAGGALALKPAGDPDEVEDEEAELTHWSKPAVVMVAGLVYVLFSQQIGFLILAPIILTGLLLLGRVAVGQALAIGILGSVIVYILFAKLLLVPLPLGLLALFGAHL
ncbi:MAG: hypothetical protein ABS76_09945 [Pelagibacterium sp. SCN 64-44]|nr:MAG: hypothetical protein ABS76_09945 [Pelagibacterium sp. SCN 64-44]